MTEPAESHALIALRAGDRIGAYKIVSLLGQGGMGAVFLARHERLDRDVAIKVLRPDSDPTATTIERFVREAKAAAAIRHPHVVDVYDVGAQNGALYMVMERLHGDPLSDVIEGRKKLSIEETLDVILPILDALDMVHDEGIVHRDVKPDNIFVVRGKRRMFPKLLDFGISKVRVSEDGQKLTGASALMGTPAYMAPEQVLEAREVDRRADLYSICAVIFECITGRRPFKSHAVFDLLRQVVDEPAPRASSIEPSIPAGLDEILAKGLAKSPDDRYASAHDLSRALVRYASAEARVLWAREDPTVTTARSGTGAAPAAVAPVGKSVPLGRSGVATIDADTAMAIDQMLAKKPARVASPTVDPQPPTPATPREQAASHFRTTPSTRRSVVFAAGALALLITVIAARGAMRPRVAAVSPGNQATIAASARPSEPVQRTPIVNAANPANPVNPSNLARPEAIQPASHNAAGPTVVLPSGRTPTRPAHTTTSRQDAGHRGARPHESVYAID